MARTTRYLNLEWLNFNNKSSSDYPILVNATGYLMFCIRLKHITLLAETTIT